MTTIAFIGLGNMGGPMAANLVKAGNAVTAFDLSMPALTMATNAGCAAAGSVTEAVRSADVVVSMLPAGKHVRAVYMNDDGVIANAKRGALFIDSSTIDVDSARAVIAVAKKRDFQMVDAPVSGGVGGATAGTLTFMVGGEKEAVQRLAPGERVDRLAVG
ncbi:MAG: NAD(P)-binding domain-containing protein, partial [Parvularculaceae bacterium]